MSIVLLVLNEEFEKKLDMITHLAEVTLSEKSTKDTEYRLGIRKANDPWFNDAGCSNF